MYEPLIASKFRKRIHSEAAFSMLELVVVTMLLGIMGSILYTVLNNILTSEKLVTAELSAYRAGIRVVDQINRELTSAAREGLVGDEEDDDSGDTNQNPTTGATPQAVNYLSSSRAQFLVGRDKKRSRADADEIRFVSDGNAQEVLSGGGNAGRVEIAYRLERKQDRDARRNPNSDIESYILLREERPAGVPDERLAEARKLIIPLTDKATSLNFRYFSNGEWLEEWGQNQLRLPEAIEVRVGILGDGGSEEVFSTLVALEFPRERSRSPYAQLTGG